MATFDPISQEVVYSLKGNIKVPNVGGVTAASVASLAQSRLNDALNVPNLFSGDVQPAVTINSSDVKISN